MPYQTFPPIHRVLRGVPKSPTDRACRAETNKRYISGSAQCRRALWERSSKISSLFILWIIYACANELGLGTIRKQPVHGADDQGLQRR